MKTALPILPTSVVGSHAKMSWWYLMRQEAEAKRLGPADVDEALDTATDIAILDQERAGVDVITDGEMRRFGAFFRTYLRRINGIDMLPPERTLGDQGYDTREAYEVTGKISAPQGLGIVEEFRYLKEHTTKPTKATCTGPTTFAAGVRIKSGYRDQRELAWDFVSIINRELKTLAAAGADFIQVDEPAFSEIHKDGKEMAKIFNATVEGVKAKIAAYKDTLAASRHDPDDFAVVQCFHTNVAATEAEAQKNARKGIAPLLAARLNVRPRSYDELYQERLVMVGDPCRLIERIEEIRATGTNYIIFMMNFATLEQKRILESMEIMAKEVMPKFAAR